MGDFAMVWDVAQLSGDWRLDAGGLLEEEGLASAVILSLFTDRLAEPSDRIPDGTTDRRGVWSDLFRRDQADRQGSRLWLLHREKLTEAVRLRARDYAREALDWMLEDGVADAVAIEAVIVPPDRLDLRVVVSKDGRTLFDNRFGLLWQALAAGSGQGR